MTDNTVYFYFHKDTKEEEARKSFLDKYGVPPAEVKLVTIGKSKRTWLRAGPIPDQHSFPVDINERNNSQ